MHNFFLNFYISSFKKISFSYILIIENNVKSILSYTMSLKYGYREKDYLNLKNFTLGVLAPILSPIVERVLCGVAPTLLPLAK